MSAVVRLLTRPSPPLVLAHRGASAIAPENTLAAFDLAVAAGADGIELDVQLARDGTPVVFHDRTLRRTTSGRGRLAGLDATRLAELDCGSWFDRRFAGERIPTLASVLERIPRGLLVNVEMKGGQGDLAEAVVDVVRRAGAVADVLLSSFDHRHLETARAIAPEVARATLLHPVDFGPISRAARLVGAVAVVVSRRQLTRVRVAEAHASGLAIVVYTVDAPREIERCARLGVDAIIANDPARARSMFVLHA